MNPQMWSKNTSTVINPLPRWVGAPLNLGAVPGLSGACTRTACWRAKVAVPTRTATSIVLVAPPNHQPRSFSRAPRPRLSDLVVSLTHRVLLLGQRPGPARGPVSPSAWWVGVGPVSGREWNLTRAGERLGQRECPGRVLGQTQEDSALSSSDAGRGVQQRQLAALPSVQVRQQVCPRPCRHEHHAGSWRR